MHIRMYKLRIKDGRSSLLCNNNFRLRSRFFFHTLFFVVPDASDDVILVYGCKAMFFCMKNIKKCGSKEKVAIEKESRDGGNVCWMLVDF